MKGKNHSLFITALITKILLAVLVAVVAGGVWIVRYYDDASVVSVGGSSIYIPVLVMFYAAVITAFPAIIALNNLLENIKKNIVFSSANVKILRLISYFCYAESLIFFIFGFIRPLSFVVSGAAFFFGLLMRVLKNVFVAAVEIKEENDFTV